MPAWICVKENLWLMDNPGSLCVGGDGNWQVVNWAKEYPANNVNGRRDGIEFKPALTGNDLVAYVQEQLLVMLMLTNVDGQHKLEGLFEGFMWDTTKWTSPVTLLDGLVNISSMPPEYN